MTISFFAGMTVLGVAVGVINAALGIGGGILIVPALRVFVPAVDAHTAKGTSLFIIIFVAGINAWFQNRPFCEAPWRVAGMLAPGSIAGGYLGAWLTSYLSGRTVTWIYVVFVTLVVIRMAWIRDPQPRVQSRRRLNALFAVAIGLATGIVSGMTGVGGGLVLVPLALAAGLSTNARVTGLSNLVMVCTCAAAVAPHLQSASTLPLPYTIGQVNVALALPIFLGAQAGSPLGRWINAHLSYRRRRAILIPLLFCIMVQMIYEALRS